MKLRSALCSLLFSTAAYALDITTLGTYETGVFDESAAEVVVFDKTTGYILVTNANDNVVDVFEVSDNTPSLVDSIDAGLSPNSVSVFDGVAAIALEAENKTDNGTVAFYDLSDFSELSTVTVGALPDMLTFTNDGSKVIVACEGEPNDEYTIDPEGSVWVIDASSYDATCINFQEFDGQEDDLKEDGVRIFGPGATASQDFEPEYIVVSDDDTCAVVSLQENNAFAKIDLTDNTVAAIVPLGFKDHSLEENAFDASNEDGAINIAVWPTMGMYQPDGLAGFSINGLQYFASANEGDSRDYDGFSEEVRVEDLNLTDVAAFDITDLQAEENLGRLKTTTVNGDEDGDGSYEEIYSYGGRSFSIFDSDLNMIYDSGSMLEKILKDEIPDYFNSNNDEQDSFDDRSDDKGPEPEGLVVAKLGCTSVPVIGDVGCRTYMFVLLERSSGIVGCDISDPSTPTDFFYFDNRDFTAADVADAGDLGPESAVFIPAADSPTGDDLLAVANEVSGTTTLYKIEHDIPAPRVEDYLIAIQLFFTSFIDDIVAMIESYIA